MRTRPTVSLLPVLILLVSALSTPSARAEEKADLSTGLDLYQRYCQSCHGEHGAGDGKVGKYLKIPPADLTTVSERNDGVFPEEKLVRIIDGRNEVRSHGARDMPIWGVVLGEDAEDGETEAEAQVDRRIGALIEVLRWLDASD